MSNDLFNRAKNGDVVAERELFDQLAARFGVIAKHKIRDGQDADDVAQEACLTVFQKYKSAEFTVSFEAWAYGVLRMKIGNYIQADRTRRRKVGGLSETAGASVDGTPGNDPLLSKRLEDCARELIARFPRYARVLNFIHQGFHTDEISRQLHTNTSNVYVILSRGRSLLRQCLETGKL